MMSELRDELSRMVGSTPVFDTVECFDANLKCDIPGLILSPHARTLLFSAGMSDEDICLASNPELSALERWTRLEPYYNLVKLCFPVSLVRSAIKDIYDLELSRFSVEGLNRRFVQDYEIPGYATRIMSRHRVERCIIPHPVTADNPMFAGSFDMSTFFSPESPREVKLLESVCGQSVGSFDDWLAAVEVAISRLFTAGVCCFRLNFPLSRFVRPSWKNAQEAYDQLAAGNTEPKYDFTGYMLDFALGCINKLGLPVQLLRGVDGESPAPARVFAEYSGIRFEVFGSGMEFAEVHQNVYFNPAASSVSRLELSRRLSVALRRLPFNKLCLAGGNLSHPMEVAGMYIWLRSVLTDFLVELAKRGDMSVSDCGDIAACWLGRNASQVYSQARVQS